MLRLGSFIVCLIALVLVGCEGRQPEPIQPPPVTAPPVSTPANSNGQETAPPVGGKVQEPAPIGPDDMVMKGVAMGQAISEVEAKLGKPSKTDTVQGVGSQVNFYESEGLEISFNPQSGKVTGWKVTKPSLLTARQIQVGATRDDVLRAYGSGFVKAGSTSRLSYALPGHSDETLNFDFMDGKLIRIFARVL